MVRFPARTNVRSRVLPLATMLFMAIAALIGADIAADYAAGSDTGHILVEGIVMALALLGSVALWAQLRSTKQHVSQLSRDLESAKHEAERFRQEAHEALQGLGEAIDGQFERWALSGAEREVALLLLKGLSHKEAAAVRSTTETTIRQQALAVYRKAGLKNRSELSAFFLEDLLLPVSKR